MLLVDSVFINNGGGLVLLRYLVDYLESQFDDVFYLFDIRTEFYFKHIPVLRKKYISNSLMERHFFYQANKMKFDKVICFGNLPPSIRLKAKVLVYFHQLLFLETPQGFSLKNKFIYARKQNILNFIKNNADFWLVQSEYIKVEFSKKYLSGKTEKIVKLPFYPELNFSHYNMNRAKYSFLYVSNSSPHKNHYRLIESFCLAYDEVHKGSLTVTVAVSDLNLCAFIQKKIDSGYPIKNVGFIDKEKLTALYLGHEYFIFPSLAESFGLGLAEAIDGGCKIIASDLSYTYEVCKPSLTFDPHSVESMKNAIVKAIHGKLPYTNKLIENDISKIMQLLEE